MGTIRVIDKTGLSGDYDFALHYARDGDEEPALDIFGAIESQAGLKLQRAKIPLEFIVVDHAEKVPSEN
jgi:uncharacterized protein (TIGR03435 family)